MKYDRGIIDAHIHIRGGFEDVGAFIDGMDSMREQSGVDAVCVASVPLWDTECIGQNLVCLAQKMAYPDRTYVFAGFDYHMPSGYGREDFLSQAKGFIDMGCDGIKMLEGKPTVRKLLGNIELNSPLYDGFYAYMEKNQIPLLLHTGDPASFWDPDNLPGFARNVGWDFSDGTYATLEQLFRETEDVLDRFPGLRVILAHFYFVSPDIEHAVRIMDRYPNVNFDITPGTEMFTDFSARVDQWRDFFVRYQDRIIFGTDNGWGSFIPLGDKIVRAKSFVGSIRRFLETSDCFDAFHDFDIPIKGMDLDVPVLEKIYYKNFVRLAGDKPKALDMEKAVSYADKMVGIYKNSSLPHHELAYPQMMAIRERFLLT